MQTRGLLAGAAACATVLAGLAAVSAAGTDAPGRAAPALAATPTPPAPVHLDRAVHGRQAVRALGTDLAAVAAFNDRSPAELRALLTSDPTMWLTTEGRLYVVDTLTSTGHVAAATAAASAPLEQTFTLHSRPTATRKIFIDADGFTLGTSAWGSTFTQGAYVGYDTDGDPSTFSPTERGVIQEIWARVAEDYAPFDVDVTTEDPGSAALSRTSSGDTAYGIRAALTDSLTARDQACAAASASAGCSVVGLANVGIYGQTSGQPDYFGPAMIFTGALTSAREIGDTVAHEVGHTIGLAHVSEASSNLGGPIMSPVLPLSAVTQWTQDDLTTFAAASSRLPAVADDAGATTGTAPLLSGGPDRAGVISSPTDVDWYRLTGCAGTVAATVAEDAVGADLDLRLSLLDSTGASVATSAPQTTATGSFRADGLGASVSTSVTGSGPWYVAVDGVGSGPDGADEAWGTGYPGTGSMGRYTVEVSGCGLTPTAPPAPRTVAATTSGGLTRATWTAPPLTGGAPILRYEVSLDGGAWTAVGTALAWSTSTSQARHEVRVRAVTSAGEGDPATVTTVVPPVVPTFAGFVRDDTGTWLTWTTAPGSDPATEFRVGDGTSGYTFNTGTPVQYDLETLFGPITNGTHYWMSLVNDAGESAVKTVVAHIPAIAPGAPTGLTLSGTDATQRTATVTWNAPADDGGAPATYEVRVDGGPWQAVSTPTATLTAVTAGSRLVEVRATSTAGASAAVSLAVEMPPAPSTPTPTPTETPTPTDTSSPSVTVTPSDTATPTGSTSPTGSASPTASTSPTTSSTTSPSPTVKPTVKPTPKPTVLVPLTRPRIVGSTQARVGRVARISSGRWSSGARVTIQWYAGKAKIRGATRTTFKPTRKQRRTALSAVVTVTRPGSLTTQVTLRFKGRVR